jgi:hypothetical protein
MKIVTRHNVYYQGCEFLVVEHAKLVEMTIAFLLALYLEVEKFDSAFPVGIVQKIAKLCWGEIV